MPKMIFVAHPISGDVEGNLKKVAAICKSIHTEEQIPVFPSFTWRKYLDNSPEALNLSERVNYEYFGRKAVDEVWLYGNCISEGMRNEMILAQMFGIPVFGKSPATKAALRKMGYRRKK